MSIAQHSDERSTTPAALSAVEREPSPSDDMTILQRDDVVVDVRVNGEPRTYLRSEVIGEAAPATPPERVRPLVESAIASVCMLLGSPLFAMIWLAIRMTSPGPALFVQQRVGQRGAIFGCLKFRTMYQDAEERLEQLLAEHPELKQEWAENHKLENDPRVTPVGAFLRRTSLDELPQLLNVVRREMAFVGPRPVVPEESKRYGEALSTVLSVPPGLTGLWQVSGRNDVSYAERIELDLKYIATHSLRTDLSVCLKTLATMTSRRSPGAY